MVGEARHGEIFAAHAYAVGELERCVFGSEHVHLLGQRSYALVEESFCALLHLAQVARRVGEHLQAFREGVVVDVARMVGVVGHDAVFVEQAQQQRRRSAQRHAVEAFREEVEACLLVELVARYVVDGEVHRVAHLYVFALDGGEHGVRPAERAVALVLDGRVAEQHFVGEALRLRGVRTVWGEVAGGDGCEGEE